ncbi:MAG: type II toxin-antitoxin system RelE/ParE family toxin [Gemmatimonadaceae bacterium]|nr:type II toxin-antitoxin system RelE/ParE family toxin [Gemmatimonadaceae bacterium]
MMLPLFWTERAVAHLEAIVDYYSITSPVYAESIVARIDHRLQLLRRHPELGKMAIEIGDPMIREVVVSPYRVFYRPSADAIEILAIVHERRHLPAAME